MLPASLRAGTMARCRLMRGRTMAMTERHVTRRSCRSPRPSDAPTPLFARGEFLLEILERRRRRRVGPVQCGQVDREQIAEQHQRADPLESALAVGADHTRELRVGADEALGQLDPRAQPRVAVAVVEEDRAEWAQLAGAQPAGDLVVVELGELG